MLLSFLSLILLLTAQIRSVKSLPWDVDHHPNHKGPHHPKNYISGHLPDYPPNLPGWLSDSLLCRDKYISWDAPKLNVLYVAAHFCTYVSLPASRGISVPCQIFKGDGRKPQGSPSRVVFGAKMEMLTSNLSTDCAATYLLNPTHGSHEERLRDLPILSND